MGSLDGLLGLDNFCHISFLIYFFISSFYVPPYLHLRPTILLYLLSLFLSSHLYISIFYLFHFFFLSFFFSLNHRGKFNFHGPSSKLSFNNSPLTIVNTQYLWSNFFLKAGTGHVPLWPYRGSVDIRKQTLINMTLTSDPQLYFLPHEL